MITRCKPGETWMLTQSWVSGRFYSRLCSSCQGPLLHAFFGLTHFHAELSSQGADLTVKLDWIDLASSLCRLLSSSPSFAASPLSAFHWEYSVDRCLPQSTSLSLGIFDSRSDAGKRKRSDKLIKGIRGKFFVKLQVYLMGQELDHSVNYVPDTMIGSVRDRHVPVRREVTAPWVSLWWALW